MKHRIYYTQSDLQKASRNFIAIFEEAIRRQGV
jgi:hypothetical protein